MSTVLDLTRHPHAEIADLLTQVEQGDAVVITRDGVAVARIEPMRRPRFTAETFDFRRRMVSPPAETNAVLEMRADDRF
jgi:antitoxin (DNA-binding transcriptional repressor) of toxin-antitoxin stability system